MYDHFFLFLSLHFIVARLMFFTYRVTVGVCHAELKGYLLTYLLTYLGPIF